MRKTISLIAFGVVAISGAAQAQAPSWRGSYDDPPRGSYTRSCREITAFDGRVWALCQTDGGGWTWSSARASECRGGGLENRDGRLSCANGGGLGGGWGGGGPGGGYRADAVLFEHAGYEGRTYEVRGDMPDLGLIRFNDLTSSIKILRGVWQVCEDANYAGRCWTVTEDQGALGRELNDRISSIRRIR